MASHDSFCLEEEELSCPICFEEFNLVDKSRQPKLLLCLHTFCLACMETLRKYDGTLQCSICRTSHHVYKVCDLMDNYVIFEHLKIKQEFEDEKLAAQLKEEYEESLKALEEQEERDAQLARAEGEKNLQEIERLRKEEENRRLEELRRQEEERLRLEEEMLKQEEERLRKEEEEKRLAERRRKEEEEEERERNRRDAAYMQIRGVMEMDSAEERESSSDSTDTRSDGTSDTETDDDEEESFQDLESGQTDDESPTSIVDPDEYETLSSDTDHYSTEIITSDEEGDTGTARSNTAPTQSKSNQQSHGPSRSASPEPDLLSEEFSGVSQANSASKPQDSLSKLLPSVMCSERADGSIIILDSSTEEHPSDEQSPHIKRKTVNVRPFSLAAKSDESDGEDQKNYSSSEEECHSLRPRNSMNIRSPNVKTAMTLQANDENCKLQ